MIQEGNVFKLADDLWIVYEVNDTYVFAANFSRENSSAIFRRKSEIIETLCHCHDHLRDECEICKGKGSYTKKIYGTDEAEILAKSVKDYIENRLLNSFFR